MGLAPRTLLGTSEHLHVVHARVGYQYVVLQFVQHCQPCEQRVVHACPRNMRQLPLAKGVVDIAYMLCEACGTRRSSRIQHAWCLQRLIDLLRSADGNPVQDVLLARLVHDVLGAFRGPYLAVVVSEEAWASPLYAQPSWRAAHDHGIESINTAQQCLLISWECVWLSLQTSKTRTAIANTIGDGINLSLRASDQILQHAHSTKVGVPPVALVESKERQTIPSQPCAPKPLAMTPRPHSRGSRHNETWLLTCTYGCVPSSQVLFPNALSMAGLEVAPAPSVAAIVTKLRRRCRG